MGIADIQAAFAATPGAAPTPAASAPLPVFQPQPAAAPPTPAQPVIVVSPGHRAITTAFGPAQIPDGIPLPPGCQYIDPATGQPYPPLNPPGEAQALAPVATPQPAPAAPQAVAPSPFMPPAPVASAAIVTPAAPSQATAPAPAVKVVLPADPAPKAARRRRSAPTEAAAPSGTALAHTSASPACGGDGLCQLEAFTTEDIREELKRRGWQVALGEAQ